HGLDVRLAQADRLAPATGMNKAAPRWKPTVGHYLGRVTKPRILEAVREGAGERSAQLIDHLKKGDMAKEAERLLAETGWLPEPLRMASLDGDQPIVGDQADTGEDAALPDFLTEDGEGDDAADEDEQALVAAE
ncbi:MAG: DNA-binding protein, partial [Bradyrhizobium sp.]